MDPENRTRPGTSADGWHLHYAVVPHRSIAGGIAIGLVWRQREGDRWIYMQGNAEIRAAVKLIAASHRSRWSRRTRNPAMARANAGRSRWAD
jgi:hypothetical protein